MVSEKIETVREREREFEIFRKLFETKFQSENSVCERESWVGI